MTTGAGRPDPAPLERETQLSPEISDRLRLQSQIIDAMADGVLVVRASDLGVVHSNTAWRQMSGVMTEEDAGFPAFSPDGETLGATTAAISRALERHGVFRTEAEIRRADGSAFWGRLTVTVAHHRTHRALWIVVCADLSAEHEAQQMVQDALEEERRSGEQLRRADVDKDVFLATVSEELNKPVAALLGHVDLLRERYERLSPQVAARSLEQLSVSVNKIASLADRLLYVLRLESGRAVVSPVRLNLAREVEGRRGALEHLLRDRQVTLEIPTDLVVSVDPDAIERIVGGLLTNAVRYSEPGSAITVRGAVASPGWVRVEVEDHGRGMSRERLQAVFNMQPDGWRRTAPGLGLRIIQQFVRLHGGTVGAESVVGSGTTVWFTLPDATVRPD